MLAVAADASANQLAGEQDFQDLLSETFGCVQSLLHLKPPWLTFFPQYGSAERPVDVLALPQSHTTDLARSVTQ